MTPATADADLLAAAAVGDEEAFAHLVERHGGAVLRYAESLVGSGVGAAEDVLQETFLAAWSAAARFRGEAGARGWLLAITRQKAMRHFRRRAGEPDHLTSLAELGEAAGWAVEEDPADRALRRLDLQAALAALAVEDREILLLRDVEGLSGEEVAALLGLGLAAMKSRLHRARLRLMAAMTPRLKGGTHGA